MKRILDIGLNDLRLFFKKKSSFAWLFGIPTAMVYFLGLASHGPDDPRNHRAPIAIENQDTNFLGRAFVTELTAQGVDVVDATNAALTARIPADFTACVLRGERTKVAFVKRPSASEADGMLAQFRFARALIALNSDILENASRNNADTLTAAGLSNIIAEPHPVTLNARFAGRNPTPTGFNFSLPGNLVMYLLLNVLVFGGATVAADRRNGVIRRLAVSPASRLEIVFGKVLGNTLLGAAQILFFLALGKFVFGVNLGANLPGVILLLLLLAWAAAGLGALAGSCALSEDKVIPICVLASLVMGALGGCWWPLELAPQTFRTVALCLPTGWAMAGLNQLISFGSGIDAALKPMLVLFGFGVVANVLAIRFFRVL